MIKYELHGGENFAMNVNFIVRWSCRKATFGAFLGEVPTF